MADRTQDVRAGLLEATSMRYHELALQRWLYQTFFVREGYPVPVVFATPMDAFSLFNKLWSEQNNPFRYLLDLKDENGTPIYEPYPSPIRYPLISVSRRSVVYRPYQNFSIHRFRHVNWPTQSDAGPVVPGKEQIGTGLTKCELGNVMVSQMPMAFDYKFQIDHYCLRPDTQAFYIEKLIRQFWRTGAVLQNWMTVDYPGWGPQYIRMYIDGDIDHHAPEEADVQDKNVEFRTTFTLVVEGFSVDLDYQVWPALWTLVALSATPDQLQNLEQQQVVFTEDLRAGTNLVLDSRPDIPPNGTCARVIDTGGLYDIYPDGIPSAYTPPFHFQVGTPTLLVADLIDPVGIGPTTVFGSGTVLGNNISVSAGTDGLSLDSSFGNVPTYNLFDFVNASAFTTTVFGTHFLATIPVASGTDTGTLVSTPFGTHLQVTVQLAAGTDAGTLVSMPFGTHTQVVITANAGTDAGTLVSMPFGTSTQVVFEAFGGTNPVSFSTTVFGTYALGS